MAAFAVAGWWGVRDQSAQPPVPTGNGPRLRAWDLVREATFRRLLIVNWFLASSWDVHTFVVPVLGHVRGLSASVIGAILGAFAIAATCVRALLPALALRLSERAVIAGAMLATAALFSVYPLLHSAAAMGLCSVLLGIALGAVQPMVMSLLHQMTAPARHGEALALRLMVINASSVAIRC